MKKKRKRKSKRKESRKAARLKNSRKITTIIMIKTNRPSSISMTNYSSCFLFWLPF
jgi:hypothetical protein